MKHDRLVLCFCVALSLASCGPLEANPIRDRLQAISNGTLDPGHPSVGMVVSADSALCTGTLVGKKTVLTAAHCVEAAPFTFTASGASYPVLKTILHPKFAPPDQTHDLAVLELASAPPLLSTPLSDATPTVGMAVVIVGYGATSTTVNDSGQKRFATNSLSEVIDDYLYFEGAGGSIGNLCEGDGGAPLLATIAGKQVQIGVAVAGTLECNSGAALRADRFLPWLKTAAGGDLNLESTLTPSPIPPSDSEAPVVQITYPAAGGRVGPSFTVTATITDNTEVIGAELQIDGAPWDSLGAAPFHFPVTLGAGPHTLRILAEDGAGNRAAAALTITVEPGPSDPSSPGGCSLMPLSGPGGWTTSILALLCLLVRRRVRR